MTDDLYLEEIKLEEEARGLTVQRFYKQHHNKGSDNRFADTAIGSRMIRHYLVPYADAIRDWIEQANAGRAGRRNLAATLISDIDPSLMAFLMCKAIFNRVGVYHEGKPCGFTSLAIYGAGLIHTELRLREFDQEHHRWSSKIHKDFNNRELVRYAREQYMKDTFTDHDLDWYKWSRTDMVHVGTALLDIFKHTTGDITVETIGTGKIKRDVVVASDGLLAAIKANMESCEALCTLYLPMVVPPIDWSLDNLNRGSYLSHNINPYPLVKDARKPYRAQLRQAVEEGRLDTVLASVNALQRTRWAVNKPVLDAVEWAYDNNIACGKLPLGNPLVPDAPTAELDDLPRDHPKIKAYRAYCFRIHESNRRMIGKRIQAIRAFQVARKMSRFEAFYFPYDLDSRGRAYPKSTGFNPQGPDYVKGLLQFADGKSVGPSGLRWLAVHGANSWGADKLPLDERADWGQAHLELARSVARDPRSDLSWTKADSPCQFLAWCIEWAAAHELEDPTTFVSHLHVDLDATCSGLQHFSAMLRDEVGGFHVNMVPNSVRQDVYGAVAHEALKLIEKDLGGDNHALAQAWVNFGMTRSITKRPVMVKPYSGTRQSCGQYVAEAVYEALQDGTPIPWPEKDLWTFQMYGSDKVWAAIPEIVVAADEAMRWLMQVARLVGKSQPDAKRIEWTTPLGLPVHQYKFDVRSRQIKTFFDGNVLRPRIVEETDRLDPRQMASSVPPSFVHSLDAAHLQLTVSKAHAEGITDFAVVHDSFGVHACDVDGFARIIREAFVEMYEQHDVLQEFLDSSLPLIREDLRAEIPEMPPRGRLDLRGILENEFFFS